jgi:LptA/(LptD N-terminal domain) LPS transport protein
MTRLDVRILMMAASSASPVRPPPFIARSEHRMDFRIGSRAAVAGRLMAQPVYPQLRKYRAFQHLLLALRLGSQSQVASKLIHPGKRSLSMRLKVIMRPAQPTAAKATASFIAIAAAGLFTYAVGAAAWAQIPPAAQGPISLEAREARKNGCEIILSGDVVVVLGDHRLTADLVRVIMSGDPNKCGAIEPEIMYSPRMVSDTSVRTWVTGVAIGNVVYENQGRIERGQSAEIDFRSGGVVVRP